MAEKSGELRFREGLERLEAIVARLEGETLELEDALDQYEQGLQLYRALTGILARAEQRVELLSGGKEGTLRWERFQGTSQGGEGDADGGRAGE